MPKLGHLHYRDECHVDPWTEPAGTVLMVHGIAEASLAWQPWVPSFSRKYRVIIPDLPGFGQSPLPEGLDAWTIEALADVVIGFAEDLKLADIHLVGAKLGGSIALAAAARWPGLMRTLSVVGSPVNANTTGGRANINTFGDIIRRDGLRKWAADTQRARMGAEATQAQLDWWTDYMASADLKAVLAIMASVPNMDLEPLTAQVQAPTLLLTTQYSALASVNAVERWASLLGDATVEVMDGDAYHLAAAYPDRAAAHVRRFIDKHN